MKKPISSTRQFGVVTGASSGIGYELARQFAQSGFDLLITAEDAGISGCARALSELGTDVRFAQIDLASEQGSDELLRRIRAAGRPVDAIALNAGVGVWGDFARETDLQDELNMIRLNIESPVIVAKGVLKGMVARGQGRVLITSSIASTMPGPLYSVYAASKAFLQSFSEGIRNELADTGVTVTALMPGVTDTGFFARAGMGDTVAGQGEKDDPADVARAGFEAMMAGKGLVVSGSLSNKVQAIAARVMPQSAQASVHGMFTKPKELKAPKEPEDLDQPKSGAV